MDDEALMQLTDIGNSSTLRYAAQLLNPASHLAKVYQNPVVDAKVVKEVNELFYDAKQSAKILAEQSSKYMK